MAKRWWIGRNILLTVQFTSDQAFIRLAHFNVPAYRERFGWLSTGRPHIGYRSVVGGAQERYDDLAT